MVKKTKYSIIANCISNYCNPIARRHGAESIMIHAIKYILAEELRDLDMPISCNGDYYEELKNLFDIVGNEELREVLSDPDDPISTAVKAIVTRPRRRNIKRAKKQISRVYHDFKRARKEKLLGDVDKSYDDAVKDISNATKEAFIFTRHSIHPSVHEKIGNDEKVSLHYLGETHSLKTLFVEKDNTYPKGPKKVFALKEQYNFEDSHAIQYKLSKYSFPYYFKRGE